MFSQSAFAGAVAPLSILLIAAIVLILSIFGIIIWKYTTRWGYANIGDENRINENQDGNRDGNCNEHAAGNVNGEREGANGGGH